MIVTLPCVHLPLCKDKMLDGFFNFVRNNSKIIEAIVILGDFVDFYELSKFLRTKDNPKLQIELDAANNILEKLRFIMKEKPIFYIIGNHEERLIKYLHREAKSLASLKCLELNNLLNLHKYKIKLIENYITLNGYIFTHGHKEPCLSKHAAFTALKLLEYYNHNVICAHSHRMGLTYKTIRNQLYIGCESGTFQNPKETDFASENSNWQFGFTVLDGIIPEFVVWKDNNFYFRNKKA